MKYKLAIFDLDGTILDTLDDLVCSVNHGLSACGYPEHSRKAVRSFIGNGFRRLLERAVPSGTAVEDIDRVHAAFSEYYKDHYADLTVPYDGVYEMLSSLRDAGCRLAVVSNKADSAVKPIIEKFYDGFFEIYVGARDGMRRKPDPDPILDVMNKLGFSADETVYIGDSDIDIIASKAAGVDCISVGWGYRDIKLLCDTGASVIVSDPKRLGEMILGLREDHTKKAGDLFLQGYNCAQSIMLAFSDVTGLEEGVALRLSSSFGGGMGRLREVCGAVSGIFMVAGVLWGYEEAGNIKAKTEHYARIQSLAEAFRERHGSIVCREILKEIASDSSPIPSVRDEEYYRKRPCVRCIEAAAAVLDDMITADRIAREGACPACIE